MLMMADVHAVLWLLFFENKFYIARLERVMILLIIGMVLSINFILYRGHRQVTPGKIHD